MKRYLREKWRLIGVVIMFGVEGDVSNFDVFFLLFDDYCVFILGFCCLKEYFSWFVWVICWIVFIV